MRRLCSSPNEELVDLETEITSANADVETMAYIYEAKSSGHFKKTLEIDGVAGKIESGGMVNGYSRVRTNQVAEAEVFFGNWTDADVIHLGAVPMCGHSRCAHHTSPTFIAP